MSEGQQYQPLYNQVPAANPAGEGGYVHATPVYAAPQTNQYAPQQPYAPQTYSGMPPQPAAGTGVPMAYAQPVGAMPGLMTPGALGHLPRTGQWSDGLCDCFNHCESLLVAFCVAPARWAQTISRAKLMGFAQALLLFGLPWLCVIIFSSINMNHTEYEYDQWGYRRTRYTLLPWAVALASICNLVMIFVGCTYRTKLREQYAIQGSSCEDCLLHAFCPLCAITQEARHVDRDTGYLRI